MGLGLRKWMREGERMQGVVVVYLDRLGCGGSIAVE